MQTQFNDQFMAIGLKSSRRTRTDRRNLLHVFLQICVFLASTSASFEMAGVPPVSCLCSKHLELILWYPHGVFAGEGNLDAMSSPWEGFRSGSVCGLTTHSKQLLRNSGNFTRAVQSLQRFDFALSHDLFSAWCSAAVGFPIGAHCSSWTMWPRIASLWQTWSFLLRPVVLALYWLFMGPYDFDLKKKTRKFRFSRRNSAEKRLCSSVQRQLGRCSWIGNRRFRVKHRRYRLLGRRKRFRLLQQLFQQRHFVRSVTSHDVFISKQCPSTRTCRGRLDRIGEFLFGQQAWVFWKLWWAGRRNASLGALLFEWSCDPWKATLQSWEAQPVGKQCNWNPWNAVRVGEASHPGPAGTRASARKRLERSWMAEEGPDQTNDSTLATALLQVLSAHTGCKQPTVAQEPPKKKGKGTGLQPSKPTGLAQSLLQMLQAAVVQNWSDEQITAKLTDKLKRVAHSNTTNASQTEMRQPKARRVVFDDTQNFPPLPSQQEPKKRAETVTKGAKSAAKGSPKPILKKTAVSPETSWRSETVVPRQTASPVLQTDPRKESSRFLQKSRYAAKIIDREWSGDPIITTIPKVLGALKEGDVVPGNLIFTGDAAVVDEVRQIWAAYDLTDDMTVAVIAPPNSVGPAVSVWWSLDRKNPHPCRYKVNLHQMAEFDGPVPKPPQVVQLLDAAGPKCVTLRLLAPWHYRQCVAGVEKHDSPSSLISEWSSLLSEPVATLTGGNWQKLDHPRGPLLVGHVRVPEQFAQKVCALSGKRGLFATIVNSNRQPVAWCPKAKEVDDHTYFRAACAEALRRGVALAFRQGGQSDIGLVGVDPKETRSSKRTAWELFGAPTHWHQQAIESFLTSEGWTEVAAKTKRRRNGQNVWFVHAICPPFQSHEADNGFWQYTNGDNSCHITVSLQGPRKRPALPSEKLVGPRKKWTGGPAPSVMATQIDESEEEDASGVADSSVVAEGPQKKFKQGLVARCVDPDAVFKHKFPDWSIIDDQGSGDCGLRAIARSLAVMQGRDLSREQIVSEGSRLRTLAVGHLLKNKEDFEPFFAPDPTATPEQRDGQPEPDTFSDYVMIAAKKNFWVDGLLLAGLSHRIKRALVVFSWNAEDGAWERHVLAKKIEDGKAKSPEGPPVCLILKDHHYRTVVPKTDQVKFPADWLRETAIVPRAVLRGAGTTSFAQGDELSPDARSMAEHSARLSLPSSSSNSDHALQLPASSHGCQLSIPASSVVAEQADPVLDPGVQNVDATSHEGVTAACDASVVFGCSTNMLNSSACSDRPRKRLRGKQPTEPPRNPHLPFVSINDPKISVWWVCDCGYQILKHADLVCHGARRKKHLNQVHGVAFTNMPPAPEGAPEEDAAKRHQQERVKRCQQWLTLAQQSGWAGMHELVPCKKGWRRWQCLQCDRSFTHWNQGVVSICSNAQRKQQTKVPSPDMRVQLANQWWEEARRQCTADQASSLNHLNQISFLNNQERLRQANQPCPQKPFGGIPMVKIDPAEVKTWWSCSLCDFKVLDGPASSEKSRRRKHHLQSVHGIRNVRPLSRQGLTVAPAIHASHNTVKKRWVRRVEEFRARQWAGSHDIATEACSISFSQCKSGKTLQFPRYRCQRCHRTVTSGDLAVSLCALHPQKHKAPPLARRKAIWKQCLHLAKGPVKSCRVKVSRASISHRPDGARATRKGLRGVRVGEASHPGPCFGERPHHLKVWAQNIRSFHTNGLALLERAAAENVQVVAMQETNSTTLSHPSITAMCKRAGWQVLLVGPSPNSRNRGGVALCCKEPLGLVKLRSVSSPLGQTLFAMVYGAQRAFQVVVHYRHADDKDLQGLQEICQHLTASAADDWLVALDANANQTTGVVHDSFTSIGGTCCAFAQHKKSSYPIDGLWRSQNLTSLSARSNVMGDGDHSIAEACFSLQIQKPLGQQFRLTHVKRLAHLSLPTDAQISWQMVACSSADWHEKLTNVEAAWQQWAHDCEAWLHSNGFLEDRAAERPLGSVPTVQSSTHAMGRTQSVEERRLRRWLRRLKEAHIAGRGGRAPSPELSRKLRASDVPASEAAAVRQNAWGLAIRLASDRLQSFLKQKADFNLHQWKTRVQTFSGACKWVRQEETAPAVLQCEDGSVLTSPVRALDALENYWAHTFGPESDKVSWDEFARTFAPFFPPARPVFDIPNITSDDIRKMAKKMVGKASGPDGFAAQQLVLLPEDALARLAQLLSAIETQGRWPQPLLHWKVTFLPKPRPPGQVAGLGDVRPIAVGPVIYRLWSSLRLKQVQPSLHGLLSPGPAGHRGLDVDNIILSLDLAFDSESYPYGAALDFQKAFDSCDFHLCTNLLRHLGLPLQVVNLLENQWGNSRRWLSFNGAVSRRPLSKLMGLPQGDAWSPLCMSLLLSVAARYAEAREPTAKHFLYLDDRTIVAPTCEALLNVMSGWQTLYDLTRLRNHASKQQMWARTPAAFAEMHMKGLQPKCTAKVLGVTLGMGMTSRQRSANELQRDQKILKAASRIAALPCTLKLRSKLAACILAPGRAWGEILNGRCPTKKEVQAFAVLYRKAVKGFQNYGGHDSRDLTACFLHGHCSDLGFYASQRAMVALHKWFQHSPRAGWPDGPRPCTQALRKAVCKLGATWIEDGFSFFNGIWKFSQPIGWAPQLAHLWRQHWRRQRFVNWLQGPRRDASIARSCSVEPSASLLDSLRSCANDCTGHERAIMTGGLMTDAHIHGLRDLCWDCGEMSCPSTHHILWECSAWHSLRLIAEPRDPMLARFGWNQFGANKALLRQMALIRQAAVVARRKRQYGHPDELALAAPPGGVAPP